jgi:hypothetical protein
LRMKQLRMKQLMSVALAACLISAIGPSTAVEATGPTAKCHDVDADFTSELTAEGCTSPLGLCASGVITHDPLIKGPMFVTINDAAASAGMPASEPASVLSVSGERILRPRRGGTVSAHVVGIGIFGASGSLTMFDELNLITGGTGRFAGATGTLHVAGRATSSTTFAGEIRGTICVP